ncbi:hypothetical protein GCM10010293_39940 [Streptomyces griseoflavus]|uniref:hypothetical protein n=1 Tax=Streptomyces griseoflavus TaxID=35619 RepID=UPI00167EBC5E|nr:hypothetical protein [Streptomyces griseoflavus]GGV36596.1 hypothetical protein GCM10010293_39940 [Streptomyces griseoflavus]
MAAPLLPADVVEFALAHLDADARREYGDDQTAWMPGEWREHLLDLDAARLDPGWVITT